MRGPKISSACGQGLQPPGLYLFRGIVFLIAFQTLLTAMVSEINIIQESLNALCKRQRLLILANQSGLLMDHDLLECSTPKTDGRNSERHCFNEPYAE